MSDRKHAKRKNKQRSAPARHEKRAGCESTPVPARAAKFAYCESMLRCPVCASALHLAGGSLVCDRGHNLAISKKGTVNFLSRPHESDGYDQDFFENRRIVFEAGYYEHLVEGVASFFDARPDLRCIVDVGCGEGFYAKRLIAPRANNSAPAPSETCPLPSRTLIGLDLSKEALQVAARGGNDVCWIVGDVAALPLQDSSMDAVLDVFTPAHYAEFARVLKPGGLLVKVVPGANHLKELRHAFRDLIRHEDYTNQLVVDHFQRHFKLLERIPLAKTTRTTPTELKAFVRMTPLLFGVDEKTAESRSVPEITVDAELLVGTPLR